MEKLRFKFRAWDKKSERMLFVKFDESERFELMQCIGVSDNTKRCHGKGLPIYENDIIHVKFKDELYEKDAYGVVEWFTTGFGVRYITDGEISMSRDLLNDVEFIGFVDKIEVVGNVYENPEFLKKEGIQHRNSK